MRNAKGTVRRSGPSTEYRGRSKASLDNLRQYAGQTYGGHTLHTPAPTLLYLYPHTSGPLCVHTFLTYASVSFWIASSRSFFTSLEKPSTLSTYGCMVTHHISVDPSLEKPSTLSTCAPSHIREE